jgi:ankyrin repeat protein
LLEHWENERISTRYLFTFVRADRERIHPFTVAIHEAIDVIIEKSPELQDRGRRNELIRTLCVAARRVGDVQLALLTGSSYKRKSVWFPQCSAAENALAAAAYLGLTELVSQFLANKIQEKLTYWGLPLACAASAGNLEITNILLKKGSRSGNSIYTAMQQAAFNGHEAIVRSLVSRMEKPLEYVTWDFGLRAAARRGQAKIVDILLADGTAFKPPDQKLEAYWLQRVLMQACNTGQDHIVRVALDRGANPTQGHWGSCLEAASKGGYEDVVRTLLAQPRLQEYEGLWDLLDRALICAARGGWLRMAQLLIGCGASVNPRRKEELVHMAWASAAERGQVDMLEFLVKAGADLNFSPKISKKTYELAVASGYTSIVRIMEENGIELGLHFAEGLE